MAVALRQLIVSVISYKVYLTTLTHMGDQYEPTSPISNA